MRCSSAVNIADLRSYALQNLVGTHHVRHLYVLRVCHYYHWLHSYALLVCRQHRRTPFVCIAEPPLYVPLSYIRTRCSSAIYIADLRSYARQNLVRIHDCPTFVRAARQPSKSPTSVRTHCRSPLVCTAVQRSYALQNCSAMYLCPTFLHAPRLPPFYIHTHC